MERHHTHKRSAQSRLIKALMLSLWPSACSSSAAPSSPSMDGHAVSVPGDGAATGASPATTVTAGGAGSVPMSAGGAAGVSIVMGVAGRDAHTGSSAGGAGSHSGDAAIGGSGTGGTAGSGGSAGAQSTTSGCTRDSLKAAIDGYFKALEAHDPSALPQLATLKFTENAKQMTLGTGLVWKTAGAVKFTRSLLDTERCGTVTEAVIPNSGTDTIYGLRLGFDAQKLSEVESIVVDPSSGFFPTPMGILNSKGNAWEDLVPVDQRSTREQLEAAGKAYFASFGDASVKPPYAMPCDRLENGFKTTQGDCSNFGSAMGIKQPAQRYPYTDLEAGITAGFVLFAGADIDFHMFKMIDGKIPWINAVVGPAVTSSGWPAK